MNVPTHLKSELKGNILCGCPEYFLAISLQYCPQRWWQTYHKFVANLDALFQRDLRPLLLRNMCLLYDCIELIRRLVRSRQEWLLVMWTQRRLF